MKNRKDLIIVAVVAVAVLAALLMPLAPRIVIKIFEEVYKVDIRYEKLESASLARSVFKGFSVNDRILGIGIRSDRAVIRPVLKGLDPNKAMLDLDLANVRFLKKSKTGEMQLKSLDDIVALPFSSDLTFSKVTGKIGVSHGDVVIRDLAAISDDFKLSFSGILTADKKIDATVTIALAEGLTAKVPQELTQLSLQDDGGGWKSITVKLEGDYDAPRVQFSSKLFRLNIGVKEK